MFNKKRLKIQKQVKKIAPQKQNKTNPQIKQKPPKKPKTKINRKEKERKLIEHVNWCQEH